MKITHENCGKYITAVGDDGKVAIRCDFDFTDCGYNEGLDSFVERHGGSDSCYLYLKQCYRDYGAYHPNSIWMK